MRKPITLVESTLDQVDHVSVRAGTNQEVAGALQFMQNPARHSQYGLEVRPVLEALEKKAPRAHLGPILQTWLQASPKLRRFVRRASWSELYIFRADTLRFLHCSKGALGNFDYPMEQMERVTPLDIKPEFDRVLFEEMIEPLRARTAHNLHFRTVHLRGGNSLYQVEIDLRLMRDSLQSVFVARGRTTPFLALRQFLSALNRPGTSIQSGGGACADPSGYIVC